MDTREGPIPLIETGFPRNAPVFPCPVCLAYRDIP